MTAEANRPKLPEYPERLLLDLRTECNLKCPMCLLYGSDDEAKKQSVMGTMSLDQARKILDEVMAAKPLIQPSWWGEPLLVRNLREHIREMKARGITVCMNTNGLTLREEIARFLVEARVEAVFFSLDSTTKETLKKVRGIDKLDKIKRNLDMMLRVRNALGSVLPRIGATMTIQAENEHEVDEFVATWVQKVDVVRLGFVFEEGKLRGIAAPAERVPCNALYQTMPVHYNGDVSICCFDSFGAEVMGNVFRDGGVKAVWHGERFTEVRRLHEAGEYDKLPFCKGCNAWAGHLYEEKVEVISGVQVLVRRSPQFDYYNRVDRLGSWTENLKGHKPPPKELAAAE